MSVGSYKILVERYEQLVKHQHTDLGVSVDELRNVAIFCLTKDELYYPSDWDEYFRDKILYHTTLEQRLVYSGAFSAAAIDKINELQKGTTY